MIAAVNQDDLRRLRVRALGIGAAPGLPSPQSGPGRISEVASGMLAVQGQDWRSARWALGVRAQGTSVEDVHEAFNSAQIVRSWPVRGTIHVLAAEDLGWLQEATGGRVLAGAPKRRAALGIDDATLDRLVDVSIAALRSVGSAGIDRDGLSTAWTEAGIDWQSAWRYHVIWWLCQNGIAVFGPVREGGEPLLVEAAEWIGRPRRLSGDEALAELAFRYARARGPVRERDLAWWSGLTVREARRAVALAAEADRLVPLALADAGGSAPALWTDPRLLDTSGAEAASDRSVPEESAPDRWRLLPAFDEHLLGYADREAQLAPEHLERIVPGKNGMFLATVVDSGRVVGTWRRSHRSAPGIEVTPLPGTRIDARELEPEGARWSRFHGLDPLPVRSAGD